VSASLCSKKYYDDCAHVLVTLMLRALAPRLLLPSRGVGSGSSGMPRTVSATRPLAGDSPRGEELRCVVAVFRHGDRTPKQKLKLVSSDPKFASLLMKYAVAMSKL
jgi:inositol hexakisphosphate/diphosphoinositol-pentakisphosphate kinase